MEIAQVVLEYIETLVYPAILIFSILLFRRQIASLLQGKLKAQYKDLVITLERTERQMQIMKESQVRIAENIQAELKEAETAGDIQDRSEHFEKVRKYIGVLSGHWESLILSHLKTTPQGDTEANILDNMTEYSDPWAEHKDAQQVKAAIGRLLTNGVLLSDKQGRLRVHSTFQT